MGGGGRRNLADLLAEQEEAIAKLDEIAFNVEAGMQRYGLDGRTGIEPLGVYEIENLPPVPGDMRGPRKSGKCSQALEFLNFLITGVWQRVRLPDGPLNEYLGNAWVHVGGKPSRSALRIGPVLPDASTSRTTPRGSSPASSIR